MQPDPPTTLGLYQAFDGEPNLTSLREPLQSVGVQLALPVISTDGQPLMTFRTWSEVPLTPNRFGIPEPAGGERVPASQLDLLLIPLVAWDDQGHRLGMGAGYYDRYLEAVEGQAGPRRVGVAYACQQTAQIPTEDWDIPLDALVCETGWFTFPH